nr:MAG TPA: PerC transcriptional activator [Caudoviricetes sp.]
MNDVVSDDCSGKLSDVIAEQLEQKGLWRRAAGRWLVVLDGIADEKLREAVALRRNYCQRMAAGIKPDTRLSGG